MSASDTQYAESIQQKQKERERKLKENDLGWLCLAGLFHLKEGRNSFGSDPTNDIVLTGSGIPLRVATFVLQNGVVTVKAAPGAPLSNQQGKPVTTQVLRSDQDEKPDYLTLGQQMTMLVIRREKYTMIRLWNKNHPNRLNFSGLRFYPVKKEFRILAEFVPYSKPKIIKITDIIGNTYDVSHPGYVKFKIQGRDCHLEAVKEETGLFFNFRDKTNGNGSYPGGRMLETELPEDNKVVLDFNLAHNPPCSYTDYATCPLPPEENRLEANIEAGEMIYPREH